MKKIISLLFAINWVLCFQNKAQTTEHLSQVNFTNTFLSPAETGATENLNVIVNYRNQWKAIATPYTINTVALDLPILYGKMGVGGYLYQENLGDNIHQFFSGKLAAAYHLKSKFITKDIISFGMDIGILQFSNNGNKSIWGEQWNGFAFDENLTSRDELTYGKNTKTALDIGAGVAWGAVYNNFFKAKAGVALKHLNKPTYDNFNNQSRISRKLVLYGTIEMREQKSTAVVQNEKPFFTPDFVISFQEKSKSMQFGSFVSFPIATKATYTQYGNQIILKIGSHLRYKDALIINGGIEYNNFKLGVSYDYVVSSAKKTSSNLISSFEILLHYRLKILK